MEKVHLMHFKLKVDTIQCVSAWTESNWKQSVPSESDEKYIVLIFENGLAMKEQMILEDILGEIGRNNNLSNFPAKLPFEEANIRLVNYNKASKQKEDKVSLETHTMRSGTNDSNDQRSKKYFSINCFVSRYHSFWEPNVSSNVTFGYK